MKKKKYMKHLDEHLEKIADHLADMAVADSKLEFDSASVALLEALNKYADFIEHHSPHMQKF